MTNVCILFWYEMIWFIAFIWVWDNTSLSVRKLCERDVKSSSVEIYVANIGEEKKSLNNLEPNKLFKNCREIITTNLTNRCALTGRAGNYESKISVNVEFSKHIFASVETTAHVHVFIGVLDIFLPFFSYIFVSNIRVIIVIIKPLENLIWSERNRHMRVVFNLALWNSITCFDWN